MYKETLKRFRIFAFWTLLKWLHRLIHCGRTIFTISQCAPIIDCFPFLRSVITFLCRIFHLHVYVDFVKIFDHTISNSHAIKIFCNYYLKNNISYKIVGISCNLAKDPHVETITYLINKDFFTYLKL
jgi:hypothetical protein